MRKRAVIFDLDGTLLDSYHGAIKRTEEVALSLGLDASKETLDGLRSLRGRPAPEIIKTCWPSADHEAFLRAWRALDCTKPYKLFPKTRKALRELRRKRIIMGILTQRGLVTARAQLQMNRIINLFSFVESTCESGYAKPDPQSLNPCFTKLTDLGIEPSQVLYVGDTIKNDLCLAQRAGLDFIGITSSETSLEKFIQAGLAEDRILSSVADLPNFLNR